MKTCEKKRKKKGCFQQPKALKMAQEQDILGSNTSLFPVSVERTPYGNTAFAF